MTALYNQNCDWLLFWCVAFQKEISDAVVKLFGDTTDDHSRDVCG